MLSIFYCLLEVTMTWSKLISFVCSLCFTFFWKFESSLYFSGAVARILSVVTCCENLTSLENFVYDFGSFIVATVCEVNFVFGGCFGKKF